MMGDKSSHVQPPTFLAEYVRVLHISAVLQDVEQKEYGDLRFILN